MIAALPASPPATASARLSQISKAFARPVSMACEDSGMPRCHWQAERGEIPISAAAASRESPSLIARIICVHISGRYSLGLPGRFVALFSIELV